MSIELVHAENELLRAAFGTNPANVLEDAAYYLKRAALTYANALFRDDRKRADARILDNLKKAEKNKSKSKSKRKRK
jgi:hypothetical protein